MYWGNKTALIDFCEINYEKTIYIAEYYNTLSNLIFILLGLYGLLNCIKYKFNYSFYIQYIFIVIVGIGSAMFHCTLRYTEQQLDELPMMIGLLTWIYIIYVKDCIQFLKITRNQFSIILLFISIIYSILHIKYKFVTIFQVSFASLVCITALRVYIYYNEVNKQLKTIIKYYILSILLATICWLIDYHFCELIKSLPIHIQFHALWHIFSGINAYIGPIFMKYITEKEKNKNVILKYNNIGLPIIVIKK